ncbi:MAG: glycosyltransferase family protein [Nanoarchaeota archaeon]
MKYLFIITGIAYGHLTREEAIINKIKELDKKAEIIIAGYETSYKHFRDDYQILKLNSITFPNLGFKLRVTKLIYKNYNFIFYSIKNIVLINRFIHEFKPDFVISDWEPFALFVKNSYLIWNYKPKYSKANNLSLIIQKVFLNAGYFTARVLRKKIIIPSLIKENNIKNYIYTGLILRSIPDKIKSFEKYKDFIIVMIGGSKYGLEMARKIKNISSGFNEKFIFFGYKCKSKNCIGYKEFKDDYLSYLRSCKAVISLGGYSGISESVFFRKPNLAFPIKNHLEQYTSVEEFKDYIEIGDIESSKEELEVKLKKFLINLGNMKKKLNTLRLSNGADEIAKFVYEKAKLSPYKIP